MTLSKEDRDRISVHSLIGYCQSAYVIKDRYVRRAEIKRWVDGLIEIADALADKFDNEQPK